MPSSQEAITRKIQDKIAELAGELGRKPIQLSPEQSIPDSGLLDSAALMSLMVWYEMEFGLDIGQEDFTLENFGTIERMVQYLNR
ncbi:MAG: phosphopantetheine-binding protein [Acidobacteriota bacterium]|nr:phosphopantetheine-binding protein [Acidobacteriota bacterium]